MKIQTLVRTKLPIVRILDAVIGSPWLITVSGFTAIVQLLESKLARDGYILDTDNWILTKHVFRAAKKDDDDDEDEDTDDDDDEDDDDDGGEKKKKVPARAGKAGWSAQEESLRNGSPVNPKPKLVDDNRISVIPVQGILGQRLSAIEKVCGGCDYLDIQRQSAEAMDQGAKGLMYMIDSPGGQVRGCPELADYMTSLGSKGISTEAFSDSRMCSAAYWLGSACDHVTATTSADIGSIGVILPWVDKARVWETNGIKWEPIVNEGATLKGTGGGPSLSAEQLAYLQETVNDVAGEFHDFVSARREDLDDRVFKAGTFFGKKAYNLGLIDEIGSYQKAYNSLVTRVKSGGSGRPVPAAETKTGTTMTKEEEQAVKLKERERLSALDKLAYTPECKAIVDKAKDDGKEASDIAVEIAGLLAQDREIGEVKRGVREGAEAGKNIRSLDPSMSDEPSDEKAISKRLVGVFAKRHPEMRQYLNGRN